MTSQPVTMRVSIWNARLVAESANGFLRGSSNAGEIELEESAAQRKVAPMDRKLNRVAMIAILSIVALAGISCKSNLPSSSSSLLPSSSGRSAAANAANDYTQPYLTDDKVTRLIDSMKEEQNPFEVIFKEGGQMRSPLDLAGKMEEFNAFARKYGFRDYQDYTAVWGRIVAGQVELWAEDMKKQSAVMFEKMKTEAQAQLDKPDLSPEMRKMYESQISSSQQALDEMNKPKSGGEINQVDLELVKKYNGQLEQAQKRYKAGK